MSICVRCTQQKALDTAYEPRLEIVFDETSCVWRVEIGSEAITIDHLAPSCSRLQAVMVLWAWSSVPLREYV